MTTIPSADDVAAMERRTTAERGAIIAKLDYQQRCAWELAYARWGSEMRGNVTRARRELDQWVRASCDALMVREVGS